jgi:branched-chain amino acid transport system substrate-binding protein
MHRRDAIRRVVAAGATLALPAMAQNNVVVLGQSAPLTGPAGELGIQMHAGARICFDALNAQGGVNGTSVELRVADDGYEPDRCKANTEKFIKDDVFGLFGYVGTPTSLAALPLAVDAKMPFFAPVTGAEALRDPFHKTVFHVRASYYDETASIVRQLTSLGLQRIGVFYQNDAYGKAGLEGVTRALATHQLTPVALGTVERNTVDVAQAVKDLVPKAPEAIVQISAYKSCAAFIRAARKAGFGGQFFNVSFVGTQALADELGKEANGIVVSQVVPFPFSTTTAIAREYLDAVHKAGGGAQPNYSSMEGYLAAKVLAEGLRRAGRNPTRESLVAGLEGIQNLGVGGFQVRYGPHAHVASSFVELSMLTGDGRVRR